jgi:serine/threonine-protein kinase
MARVWIARQTGKHGFEKLVAIKTVLPKFASDPSFQTMFLDETRIAARIEHPNVAQVLDVGEQHDTTYLVMEYVDGEALSVVHRLLNKKGARIPLGILLRIMADVCGGLHAAHELRADDGHLLNVVHRDVSPQNILLRMKGVAKLIDFGIAKARDRVAGDTNSGTVKGKVRYMAPEQAVGTAIDRRADLWSVGAILYHLISGKPPYDGENDVQTLVSLTSGRPPVPLPPTVHPAIAAIVKRALTFEPDQRFATAADMQQAIEDAMIEAKVATSISAVAGFLQESVGDRAQKRREAISLGMKAAADREKYAALMQSNVHVVAGPEADSAPKIGSIPPPDIHSSVSKQTSGTLGSAAIDLSRYKSHNRTVTVAGVAMGMAVVIVGLVFAMRSSGSDASSPAKENATKTVAPAAIPAARPPTAEGAPSSATPPMPSPVATNFPGPEASAPPKSIAVSALPAAPAAPPIAAHPVLHPTPPPTPPKPIHSSSTSSKPKIDDGF